MYYTCNVYISTITGTSAFEWTYLWFTSDAKLSGSLVNFKDAGKV